MPDNRTQLVETWVVGPEYDKKLRERLGEALKALHYDVPPGQWGIAGSQEVSVWEAHSKVGTLRIEAETYVGLSVAGPSGLVAAVRQRFELSRASGEK